MRASVGEARRASDGRSPVPYDCAAGRRIEDASRCKSRAHGALAALQPPWSPSGVSCHENDAGLTGGFITVAKTIRALPRTGVVPRPETDKMGHLIHSLALESTSAQSHRDRQSNAALPALPACSALECPRACLTPITRAPSSNGESGGSPSLKWLAQLAVELLACGITPSTTSFCD